MRTRGAVDDLVVVDLDDPDGIEGRDPAAQRRRFEDRYAELPFGLGTVPRRLDHDPWYARPGVVLWIAIALIGLVALAGQGDGSSSDDGAAASAGNPALVYPVLTEKTGVHLLFTHLDVTSDFGVDTGVFRVVGPEVFLGRSTSPPDVVVDTAAPDARGRRALVVHGPAGPIRVTADGDVLAVSPHSVVWRPTRCEVCPVRLTAERTGRTTELARTLGAPRSVVIAPDGGAVSLLAYGGPGRLELRVLRSTGRRIARIELAMDLVATPPVWSRDGRWLFVVRGATLLAVHRTSGDVRRVGNTLPPFESLTTH